MAIFVAYMSNSRDINATQIVKWMSVSMGLIYIWFGVLKFFPSLSPAEELASETIKVLTNGILYGRTALIILAFWELIVGATLLLNYHRKWNIGLGLAHIIGTFVPFIVLVSWCFGDYPFQFTLIGQYIFKNILLLVVFWFFWQRIPTKA
jgi:uncharacterized membrane protein YkgB